MGWRADQRRKCAPIHSQTQFSTLPVVLAETLIEDESALWNPATDIDIDIVHHQAAFYRGHNQPVARHQNASWTVQLVSTTFHIRDRAIGIEVNRPKNWLEPCS